ncbi:MAG: DEAD/DEAH box helicase family protein [Deltaproteobacteria bacterium]|nr:DEAD/DEAH box helicase family protein [Deltaproteobacteria bacterium]MBW2237935.1 DEAD/DEAH box helicase family protein [Deltaproteobacteria bacterium]
MKLKFDANLEYQLEAIQSVTDLFEGLPPKQGQLEVSFSRDAGTFEFMTELGIANQMMLDREQLLKNLHAVQERNTVPKSRLLMESDDEYRFPNFSVEMETGTGKTYVYLRNIFELNRKFGFKKFIIVVPSVAIREGVLSSIGLMRDHFKGLYDNVPFDHFVYNSKDLSKVRQFAVSNEIQIMIINIQAFQKDAGEVDDYSELSDEQRKKLNVIHQEQDKMSGRRPIEYVQTTNPIVIIDEPQSADNTPKAKRAIRTLNPLLCRRYSATHANPYNLLYRLDPIRAYDMRLVKQIEVSSVRSEDSFNEVFIRLDQIGYAKGATIPHAKATIHEDRKGIPKEKRIALKQGTDISRQTNRPGYDGFIVTNICAEAGLEHVEFANGKMLQLYQEEGGMSDEILKSQIRQAVDEHFKKERKFKDKGIKVLSLFFVDKVANYRWYDDEGNPQKGKMAEWFEQAFQEVSNKPMFQGLLSHPVEELHDGYFSVDRKRGKIIGLKDTRGASKADKETYELIMRDKERLLSNDEPLRFIFSHSALREGWDSPNVFQICTLREMGTERERRQTLGRGLRLPVNQEGVRVFDDNINKLTVIASESFEDYARGLQDDIEKDIGGGFKFGRIAKIAFARLIDEGTDQPVGQEASEKIWQTLVKSGYLDDAGDITGKFAPEKEGFQLELPAELEPMRAAITDEMKRYIFKSRVVNARDRRTLKYNKRIELNEDFKTLWEKINKKTRYCVEFETDELTARSVEKIRKMDPIQPVRILIDKTEVDITQAGVEGGKVLDSRTEWAKRPTFLPDILTFLQRETELTRGTLVEILKQSGRLKEFTINPQAFMTEVAKLINRALYELVVDGIKYERLEGQIYEMRLFQEKEIEEYLSRLYAIQSTDGRTPYDYVQYDSEIEREIAEKLDTNENVKFFCKLPRWFLVPTPLGNYNPDWAVVTEKDEKIYLVRETKSTHDRDQRRDFENRKIDCGKAHFDTLGVNFKVATNIHEVLAS